jgi:hypothetical protein
MKRLIGHFIYFLRQGYSIGKAWRLARNTFWEEIWTMAPIGGKYSSKSNTKNFLNF